MMINTNTLNDKAVRYRVAGRLAVEIHANRAALGRAAALACAATIRGAIALRGEARVVFACAPSQDEFCAELIRFSRDPAHGFDWKKATVFHMDDYVGLTARQPQSFRHYLREHLLDHVDAGKFHPIEAEKDVAQVVSHYTRMLSERPIDLICMGIGENGHIAFNDPPVCDFNDGSLIKVVELDEACRRQQVNDGCFPNLDAVPRRAFTLTATVFRRARRLSAHIPGLRKAEAVAAALGGPISTACPATILRTHPDATIYLDRDSARLLEALP